MSDLAAYDRSKSYRWNYDHAPDAVDVEVPEVTGDWTFCGLPTASPLGIPAGPLLNGRWVLYYASLGFDVLTYKTVRSVQRDCYALPNLVPVRCRALTGNESELSAIESMDGSWAVSFGMPSAQRRVWQDDVAWTRRQLPPEKLLCVSVVASVQPDWSLNDLANDYAQCAKWAADSGADVIETNFSCPNVSTCDGQLYQQPDQAEVVAARVRAAIGSTPYSIKIGHIRHSGDAEELLDVLSPHATALAMTNSVATTVCDSRGKVLFDGERRGICGRATLEASISQVRCFREIITRRDLPTRLIGVGGISNAADVRLYLDAGSEGVHIATAAMVNPAVALTIRRELV